MSDTPTASEIAFSKRQNEKVYFRSNYNFLSEHGGFKKGKIHTFLGRTSAGKSTLTRSLVIDVLEASEKGDVLIWLSEETKMTFFTELSYTGYSHDQMSRIKILSEMDPRVKKQIDQCGDIVQYLDMVLNKKEFIFLFFDNITTSHVYLEEKVGKQSALCSGLKFLADKYNIPTVLIAHTRSEVSENLNRLIDGNDIRGNKSINNLSEYFYVMQNFTIGNDIKATIRITKHRGANIKNRFFMLNYYEKLRLFSHDVKIDFDKLKDFFKQRNKL